MYRTRFKKEIVAEFWPPKDRNKKGRVIFLLDGMPSMPRKQDLAYWLSKKGYWVIYPRFRGTWESEGQFMKKPPEQDLKDILDELPKGLREVTYGKKFSLKPKEVFVIGGSFGGAASILSTLDKRVTKAIANCPVVDWKVLGNSEKKETSNPSYAGYLKAAFGRAYNLKAKDWAKLKTGRFYNPAFHIKDLDPKKFMMFHAQDDPYIPWKIVAGFAKKTGAKLVLLKTGGHLSTNRIVPKYWKRIETFLKN